MDEIGNGTKFGEHTVYQIEWITATNKHVGFVWAANGVGTVSVYIGVVSGHDLESDVRRILDWGMKVDPAAWAKRMNPLDDLEIEIEITT